MPSTLIILGSKIENELLGSEYNVVRSQNDQKIPLDSIPQAKVGTVIVQSHGQSQTDASNGYENFFMDLLEKYQHPNGNAYDRDALQQIKILQERTGATTLCINACYSGTLINYIEKLSPQERLELGLLENTRIFVFSSSSHPSLDGKNREITKEIADRGGIIDDAFAAELSLKYGVTAKSCTIGKDGQVKIGEKHNLHKHPALYKKLLNPSDEKVLEEWKILTARKEELESKRSTDLSSKEQKELKGLQDLFRLDKLYQDNPPTIPSSFKDQALLESVTRNKFDRIKQWLEAGANPNFTNKDNFTGLLMLSQGNPLERDTPEVELERVKAIDILLKAGANPNLVSPSVSSPLMMASLNGYSKITERLIKAEANLDYVDGGNFTALIAASGNGRLEIMTQLLAAGANPHIKTVDGLNALELSEKYNRQNHGDVAKILKPIFDLQKAIDANEKLRGKISVKAYDDNGVLKPKLIAEDGVDIRKELLGAAHDHSKKSLEEHLPTNTTNSINLKVGFEELTKLITPQKAASQPLSATTAMGKAKETQLSS